MADHSTPRREPTERRLLRAELDRVARRGSWQLRKRRVHAALPGALERCMPLLLVAPAGFLLFRLLLWFSDAEGTVTGGWYLLLLAMLLPYGLAVLFETLRCSLGAPDASSSLALVDTQLQLEGRLSAAADFIDRAETTPFMEAAIEDATTHLAQARDAVISAKAPIGDMSSQAWLWPVAGAIVLVLGLLVPAGARSSALASSATVASASQAIPPKTSERADLPEPAPPVPTEVPTETPKATQRKASGRPAQDRPADTSDSVKKTQGKTKSGESTDAGSSSGGSQAKGDPTDQGQPAASNEKPRRPRNTKPKTLKDSVETPRKEMKDSSGATAGRGSAGGSNKNPVASEWSSKDRVPPGDDDGADEDEDVDDENDADESRGGLQPNLRDRKPPTSRDLGIGFGNQGGGEGRGGPSERKKSRGTASLVLGVPVPDHVKGQINPGTTKITQERVEPQPDESRPFDAAPRQARTLPGAHRDQLDLDPKARDLLKAYFLELRRRNTKTID
ncbi:MAG: hypothetical protein KDB53_05710 [Planctomycetes bacterium]|nr:hypothetical protein [Planctomycetota bacterium]